MDMNISREDYNLFLSLLESEILDLRMKHNKLQSSIDKLQNPCVFIRRQYDGSFNAEEIKELQNSYKEHQMRLYLRWQKLCNNKTPEGMREIDRLIIASNEK